MRHEFDLFSPICWAAAVPSSTVYVFQAHLDVKTKAQIRWQSSILSVCCQYLFATIMVLIIFYLQQNIGSFHFSLFDLFVGQQVHNLSRCMDVCVCSEFADSHKTSLVNYYLYQSCHYFYFMPKLNSAAVSSQVHYLLCIATALMKLRGARPLLSPSKNPQKQTIPKTYTASSFWNLGKVLKCINSFHWQLLQNSMIPAQQLTQNDFPYVKLCLKHTRN